MEKKSTYVIKDSLYELMTTLIYPAILGSILFLVLSAAFSKSYNFLSLQFLFTTFMLFNFFITFMNTVALRKEKEAIPTLSYSWWPFFLDIFEVLLLFYIFINLGYKFSEDLIIINFKKVYLIYGFLQILHFVWAIITKHGLDPILIITQIIRLTFCMLGVFLFSNSIVFNCLAISSFYFILILSLLFDNGYNPNWRQKLNSIQL